MSLIICPECNKSISDSAEVCPNCGYKLKPKKRPVFVIIIAAVFGIIALIVLISGFFDLTKASTKEVGAKAESTQKSVTESKDNLDVIEFEKIAQEDISNLPDRDSLTELAGVVLYDIGVTSINDIEWGNYHEKSKIINIDFKCSTESEKNLIVSCTYYGVMAQPKWIVWAVRDFDLNLYYYISDEQIPYIDLYDYATGDLVSKKTKDFKADESANN